LRPDEASSAGQIDSLDELRIRRRLADLFRGYDDLDTGYRESHAALAGRSERSDINAWQGTLLAMLEANLGSSTLRAFFAVTDRWPPERPVAELVLLGHTVRNVGRQAGSLCARAMLANLPGSLRRLPRAADLAAVLSTIERVAEAAPESVQLVATRLGSLLLQVDAAGFDAWASAGLRSCGYDVRKRRAYFGLDDPLSLSQLSPGPNNFFRLERRLIVGLKALWDWQPPLRALPVLPGIPAPRRVSLAGGLLRFPGSFTGATEEAAEPLYLAAAAHAGAHFRHSAVRFPVGKLKALQVALVSLIEDARIETLAIREMPGLARLWLPFHAALPFGGTAAPALMARLARALLDPVYVDDDAWVAKGKALFALAQDRLADPAISREIGGILGNDLGQMRVQFNARTYVVEPAYRDDNLALWDFGDEPDSPAEEIDIVVDSVRIERRDQPEGGRPENQPYPGGIGRARYIEAEGPDGIPVASYPEWDHAQGLERPDWTTVLERDAPAAHEAAGAAFAADRDVMQRVDSMTRRVSIGRSVREKGQRDGDILDLDACVAAAVARRSGKTPEDGVFQRVTPGPHDLAVLLLLDLSESTADLDGNGRSVLAVEREAAAIMAQTMNSVHDTLAVHGFSSAGREKVYYQRIKDFAEPFDAIARARLAGLRSSHSTRLGAALRHACSGLASRRAFRRVLLVLTDGEPSDIDVPDPDYLREDARRAVLSARKAGIDVFAFALGDGSFRVLDRIVGERRVLRVPRIETLPMRIMQLFAALKK
jgi:nitric oxide reductase NorD protein